MARPVSTACTAYRTGARNRCHSSTSPASIARDASSGPETVAMLTYDAATTQSGDVRVISLDVAIVPVRLIELEVATP